ncbi:LysE family transporter [Streptomyces sp. NPDC057654]|uniref:LysE family transporter n=1 Tax=Streptomyces sp. NPDC057654 TaxID=3346196 RepID=UPI003682E330
MTESIIAGMWAGYGLAVPVGAVAVLMINTTARTSFRVGAAAAMGATTADALYAVAAVLGGSALATAIAPLAGPLRFAAAVILIGMAIRTAAPAFKRHHSIEGSPKGAAPGANPLRSYLTFLGLTALNPWPAIYFVALFLGRQSHVGSTPPEEIAYVTAIVAASGSWQLLLAGGGALLGRFLTSRRGRFATALLSSALIAALAINIAVAG